MTTGNDDVHLNPTNVEEKVNQDGTITRSVTFGGPQMAEISFPGGEEETGQRKSTEKNIVMTTEQIIEEALQERVEYTNSSTVQYHVLDMMDLMESAAVCGQSVGTTLIPLARRLEGPASEIVAKLGWVANRIAVEMRNCKKEMARFYYKINGINADIPAVEVPILKELALATKKDITKEAVVEMIASVVKLFDEQCLLFTLSIARFMAGVPSIYDDIDKHPELSPLLNVERAAKTLLECILAADFQPVTQAIRDDAIDVLGSGGEMALELDKLTMEDEGVANNNRMKLGLEVTVIANSLKAIYGRSLAKDLEHLEMDDKRKDQIIGITAHDNLELFHEKATQFVWAALLNRRDDELLEKVTKRLGQRTVDGIREYGRLEPTRNFLYTERPERKVDDPMDPSGILPRWAKGELTEEEKAHAPVLFGGSKEEPDFTWDEVDGGGDDMLLSEAANGPECIQLSDADKHYIGQVKEIVERWLQADSDACRHIAKIMETLMLGSR